MKLSKIMIALLLASPNLVLADDSARNEFFARQYQQLCELIPKSWQTANTADEAAQTSLSVTEPIAMAITLNKAGEAYLDLSIENWDEKLIVFHSKGLDMDIAGADVLGANIDNQQCDSPRMTITHINTHEWGSYTLVLKGQPDQEVTLKITREELD